jgi:hypothetical protein
VKDKNIFLCNLFRSLLLPLPSSILIVWALLKAEKDEIVGAADVDEMSRIWSQRRAGEPEMELGEEVGLEAKA